MQLELKGTRVLDETLKATTRYVINQGGTRSSKTYSICQYIFLYCLQNKNKTITIVRKTLPALKGTALRDLKEVFLNNYYWDDNSFNKTELQYKDPNGNLIEFISADNPQKLRGRKRDLLWCNEANELTVEDFRQLSIRTTERILIDINPSDQFSWIYDLVESPDTMKECTLIKSTYKDNPFIPKEVIREIEANMNDEEWFKVFGLGERSVSKDLIYTRVKYESFPDTQDFYYGLDFGYNHPTALVKVHKREKNLYAKEELYQSYLTTPELIEKLRELGISKNKVIYCDYARPEIIADLKKAGFNAQKANKEVKPGIDYVKSHMLIIDPSSGNLKRELNSYKWKTHSNGFIIDEPVKMLDDAMDALRYGAYSSKKTTGFSTSFSGF